MRDLLKPIDYAIVQRIVRLGALIDYSKTPEIRNRISLFLIELCDLAFALPKLDCMAVRELFCNTDSLFVVA